MIKKLTFLCLMLAAMTGLMAQNNNSHGTKDAHRGIYNRIHGNAKDINFNTSDIQFWCGTGDNEATVIIAWDDYATPTALVWGVRWNSSDEDVVAISLIDSIATYDSRFSYDFDGGSISNVEYTENGETMSSSINYWCYYLNGEWAMLGYGAQPVEDGDVIEMSGDCMFGMTNATAAIDPNASVDPGEDTVARPEDFSIAASDILYWVGMGTNEAVIAVTWAAPDTAMAWGVRFDGDTITLQSAMDSIACHDYRFSYIPGSWGIDDIVYDDYRGTHLSLNQSEGYNYWWSNINGNACSFAYDAQPIVNGDFMKWGDPTCGIVVDTMWGYPSEIAWQVPVFSVSQLVSGPFCGAAETEGSEAIAYTDARIKGWATGCEIVYGPENITVAGSPLVSYGEASAALGACDNNNLNVVSLGDGGMATLTFDHAITNGEGPDFAIFENSFNDNFLELAFVEVSTDGERFVRFPATSLTSACQGVGGMGGIDPTYIDNLAGKYRVGFGTGFDLEQLRDSIGINIDSIVYVRVVDVVGSIDEEYATYDQYGHIVVDPFPTNSYSTGFDLDGACVLNWLDDGGNEEPEGINSVVAGGLNLYPNPAQDYVTITVAEEGQHVVAIYDMAGRQLQHTVFAGNQVNLGLAGMANGVYMVSVDGTTVKLIKK